MKTSEKFFYELLESNTQVGVDTGYVTDEYGDKFWSDYDEFVDYIMIPGSYTLFGTNRENFELDKSRLFRFLKKAWEKFKSFDDFKSHLEDWINEDLICEFFPEDYLDEIEVKGIDELSHGLFCPNLKIIPSGTIEKFNDANKHLWLWRIDPTREKTVEVD